MIHTLIAFVGSHPLILFALCVLIAAGAVLGNYFLERRHQRLQAEQDAAFQRILAAAHRIPTPMSEPASQGGDWRKRRAS